MADHSKDNKRIAKNTLMLYIRMILIILVTFYSFRILLEQLGASGYGTYNAVAGVIILFAFLSGAMRAATQRYISYYLGKKDKDMLRRVFSMSINIHVVICGVLLLLAETVGLWFLNSYMRFPPDLEVPANILYQVSILSFLIQILTVPYQAVIISHERMSFYAYFSILEAAMKLGAVLILMCFSAHKLIIYGIAILIVSILVWLVYKVYCSRYFDAYRYRFDADKPLFKELISFSGWNMLGGIGTVAASQGINILFNVFCGVVVNAAMGVANQVGSAVSSFVTNFQTAFTPQLVKSYANKEEDYLFSLIFRASRLSFFLIFTLGLPLLIYCPTVLGFWLGEYPSYAVDFTRLMIIYCMIETLSGPLWTTVQASGNIRNYMILIFMLIISNVPAGLLILTNGLSPVWVIAYKAAMAFIILIYRLMYMQRMLKFPLKRYLGKVSLRILYFILLAAPLPLLTANRELPFGMQLLLIMGCVIEIVLVGFVILLTPSERNFFIEKLRGKLRIN